VHGCTQQGVFFYEKPAAVAAKATAVGESAFSFYSRFSVWFEFNIES